MSEKHAPEKSNLMLPAVFGLIFGFLLQRGGMGSYEVLVGQLLLQDWSVVKVMLTAIVVGMIGVRTMHAHGLVKLHLKPTRLVLNVGGGLLFGAGFALLGYCPGSAAVALGEGHWDAIFGMAGLVAGSYLYAEISGLIDKTAARWGNYGKLSLPEMLGLPTTPFVFGFALLLVAVLLLIAPH